MNKNNNLKIIVGMSGGVDSSVAAQILLSQGYQVEGMFMKNWEDSEQCSAEQDVKDAQKVCDTLGIKLHKVNFANEYWENVFAHFLSEYQQGRTPNPDILCNREIKFKVFLQYAKLLGAQKIATGHYAGIKQLNQEYSLVKALDKNKDQTYFLYTLQQEQLAHVIFPLAKYTKQEIRELAKKHNLITHDKKDSTGICFIGEVKFKNFLKNYLPNQPGDIVSIINKEVVGHHDGLMYYTIGQRKGLHIGGIRHSKEEPWYVIKKDLHNNILYVAQGDSPLLYTQELIANELTFVQPHSIVNVDQLNCKAKVRYRQDDQDCTVIFDHHNSQCTVKFAAPQRAVTPGQSIVFYQDDVCLGGGIIIR